MNVVRLASLAVVTLLVLGWAIVRPELLYVERVAFEGVVRSTEAELRHLADIRNGTTIWGVDTQAVSDGVLRHPWVAGVQTERELPNRVIVRVTEYEPEALVAFDGGLFYVDGAGTPFLRAHSDELDFPVVTGITSELEEVHPKIPRLAVRDALYLIRELDRRKLVSRDSLSEIYFHPTRGFTVRTTGAMAGRSSARVLIALGDYERQLRRLAALVDAGVDLSQPLHVDLGPKKVAIVRPLDAQRAFLAP